VLLTANYTTVRLGFQHPALARALEGTPTTLVQDGKMLDDNLRRYLITRQELMAAIRCQGGRNLQDLEVVVLKASGALTVGQHDHLQELLERLQRTEAAVTHGQDSGSARWAAPTADIASRSGQGLGKVRACLVGDAGVSWPVDVRQACR
jgi:hypothetical protein